jgi:hypothetical protein
MAGAAAALVGLLFVAISVAPNRLVEAETRLESQALAGSALLAFTNVLVFSTVALIPGVHVGWMAILLGVGGIAFALSRGRTFLGEAQRGRGWVLLVVGMVVVFGWELVEGITLSIHPNDHSAVTTIAALLVGSLSVGVGRSWKLIGMHDTGLTTSIKTLVKGEAPGPE